MLTPFCSASLSRESPCPPTPIMAMLILSLAERRRGRGAGEAHPPAARPPAASAEILTKRRREMGSCKDEEAERIVFYRTLNSDLAGDCGMVEATPARCLIQLFQS